MACPDNPPIVASGLVFYRDRINYGLRLVFKTLCFGFFGLGSFFLGALVYPFIRLTVREPRKLQRVTRNMVKGSFGLFVRMMEICGLIEVEFANEAALAAPRGLIVTANHPSLIDVVILGSKVQNANCIVKEALMQTPFVKWIVRNAYISNALSFTQTIDACRQSLDEGCNLIVFPEGTRTRQGCAPRFQRGAARIALATNTDIMPVRIIAEDVQGLRKNDPFFSLPRTGPVRFRIEACETITVDRFTELEPAKAARALTKQCSEVICNLSCTELSDGKA